MSNLFLKRVGFSMVLGMASLQALAASSDDFVDAATEAGIAEVKMILEWRDESFDRSYVNNQVEAHEKAVELFRKEAASSDKAELKAFAGETLPKLEEHLKHAKELQAKHGQ
ncbi:hypothetical protein WR25_25628 [Diploscapter pachys]|uniref:DUF4142 domain-containing protein n=1 Tax=Diploscapter pachys TaxID=2018661 RepID=A0A2A2KAF2_9BILA|nr:hypothetical protein WR25_25628 [Diploscapter pachys]